MKKKHWLRSFVAAVTASALVWTCVPLEALAAGPDTGAVPTSATASTRAATLPVQGRDWTLETDGTLTITSNFGMHDWQNQSNAFKDYLIKAIIGPDVTAITETAFFGCDNLCDVNILGNITYIGGNAFAGCDELENFIIPESVTSILGEAFCNCNKLKSIYIPDSVVSIAYNAFSLCDSLSEINVGNNNPNYKSIDGVLFSKDLKELIQYPLGNKRSTYKIPNSVTVIDSYAFYECKSLSTVEIPNSVSTIGVGVFAGCSNLLDVTVPGSIADMENSMFANCDNLESVTIQDGVSRIGGFAFSKCKSLISINIPDSVNEIGNSAFEQCNSLVEITLPNNITSIFVDTFNDCKSLSSITLPDNLIYIYRCAFRGCDSLTELILPSNLTSIGESAFYSCDNLTSVLIPDSVDTIDVSAFNNCDNLTIYCNAGSCTETYCIENKIPYKLLDEYPGGSEETPVATTEWFGKVLSNTTNSITIDIDGERTLQVAPGADPGVEMTDNSLQNQYIYGTFDAQNRIVSLKVISPQVGTLKSAGGEIEVEIETDAGLKTYQWYRPSSIPGGLIEWMETPVQFYADGNEIFLIRSVKTVIGTPTAVNVSSTPATATIDGQSYAIADGFADSVSKVLNQKALFMLYNDQIEYAKALSTYAPHVDLSVSWNPDRVTYRNDKYDQTALKASVTLTNPSSNFPDGVDLNALKQQPELNVQFTDSITLELSDGNNNGDVGSFLCFGDKYSDPWFGDPKVTQDVKVPQEKTTLAVGDSVTLEVPVSINSKYVPEQGITQKSVNVAVTSLPMTSGSGQTLEMPGGNFDSLVAYYPENIPDETEINDTAKEAAKKLQSEINKVNRNSKTAWSPYLQQIFTQDQLDAIAASLLVKITIATTPDTDLSDTAKTVLEQTIKKHLGIEWLKKPSVGFDSRNFSVSSSVFVSSEKYGDFTITFTSGGLAVGSNADGVPAFATLGDITYQITTTKNTNTSALIKDGITVNGSNFAGFLTQANLQAFSEVVYEVIKKELIMPYWGDDLNKSVDILFGKTINKILYYFNQSTASVAITFMEAPGKKYKIECPVDVYVYDNQDNLKGSIVNNRVEQTSEDLSLSVEGDTKYVTLWNNDYKLKLIGTDTGTMNITIDEYAGGDVSLRTLRLNELPLTVTKTYTGSVDQTIMDDKSKYNLIDESNVIKEPDSDTLQVQAPSPITGIQVTQKPSKTTYKQGEDLDLTGLQVTATREDKSTADISDAVRVSGYDKNQTGTQTITVSYLDQTTTFEVNVVKNSGGTTPPSGTPSNPGSTPTPPPSNPSNPGTPSNPASPESEMTTKVTLQNGSTVTIASPDDVIEIPQSSCFQVVFTNENDLDGFALTAGNGKSIATDTVAAWNPETKQGTYTLYGLGAPGTANDTTGIYVNGVKLFTMRVVPRPLTSDTTVDFAMSVGQTYQFWVKPDDPSANYTFNTANGDMLQTSIVKDAYPDEQGRYLCRLTVTGRGDTVGVYCQIDGNTYKLFTVNCQ